MGALTFLDSQNKGLKLRKNHLELPEFCEIVSEEGRKEIDQ
jgi:hypothetical protein